jgi:hypothetical protein
MRLGGPPGGDYGLGQVTTKQDSWNTVGFKIEPPGSGGDATVPHESGEAPRGQSGVQEIFKLAGIDHQNAYSTDFAHVMAVVQYCLAKIVQKAN